MYLLTFTFLIIGVLGIYTQVMAVEAARIYASQTGIGQGMIYWHEAAVSLATNVVSPASITAGCALTANLASPCQASAGVSPSGNVLVTGAYKIGASSYPSLPPGYSTAVYAWNSIAFSNGGNYVITYASLPGANGFISAGSTQLGITDSDLYQQVRQSGIPITNFGYVSNGNVLITPANLPSGQPIEYNVPPAIPVGSFAIISGAGLCNGC